MYREYTTLEHLVCTRHFPQSSSSQNFGVGTFIKGPQQALGYLGYLYDVHPPGDKNEEII